MDHHHRHPSRFVIEASEVESMAKSSGLSLPDLLHSLVKPAQTLARPPISTFPVGAVGLGSDGRIFLGVNLEFPGLPLHHSVHAEQFLLTNLAAHRSPRLLRFAVSAAPCGHCRQFLQELRNASQIQILISSSEIEIESQQQEKEKEKALIYKPLSSMLPNPFGPYDLLDEETPLLLEPHHNGLSFPLPIPNQNGNQSNGISELHMEKNEFALKMAALEAANSSHSPYSGCPSGVALMDCEGKIYRGSYTESAAYNPSLGPVQAALVAYLASGNGGGGGGGYERIVGAVLVEKEGALVRQEHTAKLLLNVISPKCEFRVFHCCSSSSSSSSSSPSSNGWKKGPSSCCE